MVYRCGCQHHLWLLPRNDRCNISINFNPGTMETRYNIWKLMWRPSRRCLYPDRSNHERVRVYLAFYYTSFVISSFQPCHCLKLLTKCRTAGGPRVAFSGHVFQPLRFNDDGSVQDLNCSEAANFQVQLTLGQGAIAHGLASSATDGTPSQAEVQHEAPEHCRDAKD